MFGKRIVLSVLLLIGSAGAAQASGIGLRMMEIREPTTATTVPFAVLYPASDAEAGAVTQMGPYTLHAKRDAKAADGTHPLILLSHGHGGSMFGHHDLGELLARHGYVVAMLEHAGDSYRDQTNFGTDRVLLGRAWQASAVISAVLADAQFKSHVDAKRIGAAGFSAGGYTTLLLLGAKPDFSRFESFCEKYPKTAEICDVSGPPKRITVADPPPTADARVRAGFAMAPFSILFDADGLKAVRNPMFLYTGTQDEVLLPIENAQRISKLLPNLYRFREIQGAGHYVFLAPCPAAMAEETPMICSDPPGIDRAALHRQINDDAVEFFDKTLK